MASGALVRLRRGVYADDGACVPVTAAALHGGSLACASAARHLGLWVLDDALLHVWLRSAHRRVHGACTCVDHWDEGFAGDPFGLPSLPRLLLQLLRCQGVEAMFVSLESALRQRMLSHEQRCELRATVPEAVRELIDFARADADSGLESLLRLRLRRHGIRVRTQVTITGVGVVDFLLGDRLIIEVDGKAGHLGYLERHKDLVRDASAAMWDYTTLRFDYASIVHDWDLVERAILAQVRAGRHNR